jgi:hypothetical protein
MSKWPIYFHGDSIDACFGDNAQGYLKDFLQAEEKYAMKEENDVWTLSLWDFIKLICSRWVAYPYRAVLRLLLERASR